MSALYGATEEDNSKKTDRVTSSFDTQTMKFINQMADEMNISRSEVVERLVKTSLNKIIKQKELIEQNPLIVAFDLITR